MGKKRVYGLDRDQIGRLLSLGTKGAEAGDEKDNESAGAEGADAEAAAATPASPLLAVGADDVLTIIDWKTGRPPAGDQLREGWQTVVYQYVLTVAGAPYLGGAMPAPDAIQMIYWYAEYPASPAIFPYGADQHREAERRLAATITQIAALSPAQFDPCEEEATCHFCAFQSYCKRVPDRIDLDDDEYPDTEEWDWSDVPEYEY